MSEDTKDIVQIEERKEEQNNQDLPIINNSEKLSEEQQDENSKHVPQEAKIISQQGQKQQVSIPVEQTNQEPLQLKKPRQQEQQSPIVPQQQQDNFVNQNAKDTENDQYQFESKMISDCAGEIEELNISLDERRTEPIIEHQYELQSVQQFGDSILGKNEIENQSVPLSNDRPKQVQPLNSLYTNEAGFDQNIPYKQQENIPQKIEKDQVSKSALVQSNKEIVNKQINKVVKSDMVKANTNIEEVDLSQIKQIQKNIQTMSDKKIELQGLVQQQIQLKDQEQQIDRYIFLSKSIQKNDQTSAVKEQSAVSQINQKNTIPTVPIITEPIINKPNKQLPGQQSHEQKVKSHQNQQQKQEKNIPKKKKMFKVYSISSSSSDSEEQQIKRIAKLKEDKNQAEVIERQIKLKEKQKEQQKQINQKEVNVKGLNQKNVLNKQRKYSDQDEIIKKIQEVQTLEKIESQKSKKKRKKKHHTYRGQTIQKKQSQQIDKAKDQQTKIKIERQLKNPNGSTGQPPTNNSQGNKNMNTSEQLPTNATLAIQRTQIQHQYEVQHPLNENSQHDPNIPPLTSQTIVVEAHKERMGSTLSLFSKYVFNYTKALNNYKTVIHNVSSQITRRKDTRRVLQSTLVEYFDTYARINNQLNSKCHSFDQSHPPMSNNPFGNMKLQFRDGYRDLLSIRNGMCIEYSKNGNFVINTIISKINNAFSVYFSSIQMEQVRQRERRSQQFQRQKTLFKVVSQVEKIFRKGIKGKFKVDILTQLARFVNQEITHREYLKIYGKGLMSLRDTFKTAEETLFHTLQPIINDFKNHSKMIYSIRLSSYFEHIEDMTQAIRKVTKFDDLSPLTDIDYVKYVLELQQKKDFKKFKTRHFQNFLDLIYFDRLVGNIRDLYKGATCKIFPMAVEHQQLIHTISGNLVHFNVDTDHCLNTFIIKNINARILTDGVIQFDELLKGLIFDDSRTVRIKLKDNDRAEELICYLNEKQQDIVIQPRLEARKSQ